MHLCRLYRWAWVCPFMQKILHAGTQMLYIRALYIHYIHIAVCIYLHTESFCSATQPHEAWTPCKQISYVLKALSQTTGSTTQRKWYLSYAATFLFLYQFVYFCRYFTHFFLFGLLQRLYRNFKLKRTHRLSSFKQQCVRANVSGCRCLDFALLSLSGSRTHSKSVPCQKM